MIYRNLLKNKTASQNQPGASLVVGSTSLMTAAEYAVKSGKT